jgi:hypothetical protein
VKTRLRRRGISVLLIEEAAEFARQDGTESHPYACRLTKG